MRLRAQRDGARLALSPGSCAAGAQDQLWLGMAMGLVGETIDPNDELCGARIVDKSGNKGSNQVFRIELWLRTKDSKVIKKILDKMIEVMLDGKQPKGRGLGADDFQWKMHGV